MSSIIAKLFLYAKEDVKDTQLSSNDQSDSQLPTGKVKHAKSNYNRVSSVLAKSTPFTECVQSPTKLRMDSYSKFDFNNEL